MYFHLTHLQTQYLFLNKFWSTHSASQYFKAHMTSKTLKNSLNMVLYYKTSKTLKNSLNMVLYYKTYIKLASPSVAPNEQILVFL